MDEIYELKYKCPKCEEFTHIDAVHHCVTFRETFILASDGEPEFTESDVLDYGDEVTFCCSVCGQPLPVEYTSDMHELTEWLKRRPENLDRIMENL